MHQQIFILNGYLIQFIDRCMKSFPQKNYVTKAVQDTVNKKQLLIVLTFQCSEAFLVRERLQSSIKKPYHSFLLPPVFPRQTSPPDYSFLPQA